LNVLYNEKNVVWSWSKEKEAAVMARLAVALCFPDKRVAAPA
jgi:hypothetical protein